MDARIQIIRDDSMIGNRRMSIVRGWTDRELLDWCNTLGLNTPEQALEQARLLETPKMMTEQDVQRIFLSEERILDAEALERRDEEALKELEQKAA